MKGVNSGKNDMFIDYWFSTGTVPQTVAQPEPNIHRHRIFFTENSHSHEFMSFCLKNIQNVQVLNTSFKRKFVSL